ncbi:MAG: hypothetical protein ACYSUI_20880, partial [Planctomycetota bacterium]
MAERSGTGSGGNGNGEGKPNDQLQFTVPMMGLVDQERLRRQDDISLPILGSGGGDEDRDGNGNGRPQTGA